MHATRLLVALLLPFAALAPHPADSHAAEPHPLIGRVWDVAGKRYASASDLPRAAAGARFVLLGEVHDNPAHHRLRHELLESMIGAGQRPAVVMEQFDVGNQAGIDDARRDAPGDALALQKGGRLDVRGWNWTFYEPFIRTALQHGLPLFAGNLSRQDAFAIATKGVEATLGSERRTTLGLDIPLPPVIHERLVRTLDDGHCGKAPEKYLTGMIDAQRARDAVMAEVLARQPGQAVLIAGNGHVRRDFGVPHYLGRLSPGTKTLVIGFVETSDGRIDPSVYASASDGRYDFVWFTAGVEREDPCKGLNFDRPTRTPG